MVIVTSVASLPAPLSLLRATVIELLERSPGGEIETPVRAGIERVSAQFDVDVLAVRVAKLGPKLYVEVEGAVDGALTITDEQQVREELLVELDHLPYDIWL